MPCQSNSSPASATPSSRSMNANAASLGAVPISSVTAVGAPWYTSGTHMWYGTAPSLKAMPETTNTSPKSRIARLPPPRSTRVRDALDVERAGGAVDHRHAVEQHARGQRAQHEVLHRRLGGRVRPPVHRHHRVQRQRLQLEAEVEREEAVGRDHHHHAEQREQRQHEGLAAEQPARREVAARVEQHQRDGEVAEELEQVRQHVVDDQPVERERRLGLARSSSVTQAPTQQREPGSASTRRGVARPAGRGRPAGSRTRPRAG